MKLYHILGTCELSSFFKSSQTVERRGNAFSVVIFLHRTFSCAESKSMANFRAVSEIEHMNVIETVEDKHDNFLHKVGRQGIMKRTTCERPLATSGTRDRSESSALRKQPALQQGWKRSNTSTVYPSTILVHCIVHNP